MVDATEELLAARRKTHGDWGKNAAMIQTVMRVLETADNWDQLSDVHREGIHLIIHKVVRSVNGDFMEPDHYDDVAGYAKLIAKWIRGRPGQGVAETARMVPRHPVNDDHGPAAP